jgi:hypothetical protein
MSDQIVTIRFSIPDSWDAESFAADMGECYAELNPELSEQVAYIESATETLPRVSTFTAGQRYTRRGK